MMDWEGRAKLLESELSHEQRKSLRHYEAMRSAQTKLWKLHGAVKAYAETLDDLERADVETAVLLEILKETTP